MTEILEELRKKLETGDGNMTKAEAQIYLQRHELLEGKKLYYNSLNWLDLDKRYPRQPEELPAEEEEKSEVNLEGKSPEEILGGVQMVFISIEALLKFLER